MVACCPCPVSYTHLDVYKRQGLVRTSIRAKANVSPVLAAPFDPAFCRRSLSRGLTFGLALAGALLITGVGVVGASSHSAKAVVLSTQQSSTYGTILVSGDTLYSLLPSKTACAATCLKYWPELTLPKGVNAATSPVLSRAVEVEGADTVAAAAATIAAFFVPGRLRPPATTTEATLAHAELGMVAAGTLAGDESE